MGMVSRRAPFQCILFISNASRNKLSWHPGDDRIHANGCFQASCGKIGDLYIIMPNLANSFILTCRVK